MFAAIAGDQGAEHFVMEIVFLLLFSLKYALLTLPKNISPIRMALDTPPSVGVAPRESPTVPTAEAVSKRAVFMGIPSSVLIAIPPVRKSVRYIRRIVAAFFIVSSVILLPKK